MQVPRQRQATTVLQNTNAISFDGVKTAKNDLPSICDDQNKKSQRKSFSLAMLNFPLEILAMLIFTIIILIWVDLYCIEHKVSSGYNDPLADIAFQTIQVEPDPLAKITFQTKSKSAPPCSKPLDASDVSLTLVTQVSYHRLWMMSHHCNRIPKDLRVSIAVYTDKAAEDIYKEIEQSGKCGPNVRTYFTVQTLSTKGYRLEEYPINKLRNMAMSVVRTSHVMYLDFDFWSSDQLFEALTLPSIAKELASDPYLAIIVPAFQMDPDCVTEKGKECYKMMPNTVEELKKLVDEEWADVFHPTNKHGYILSLLDEWLDQGLGELMDVPCIMSNRFEPFVVVRYCDELPPFQEAFSDYGKNIVPRIMQMRKIGYKFSQLGGAYIIHHPHYHSSARWEWDKKPEGMVGVDPLSVSDVNFRDYKRGLMDSTFLRFRKWLDEEVEDKSRIHFCEDAYDDDTTLWVNRDEIN